MNVILKNVSVVQSDKHETDRVRTTARPRESTPTKVGGPRLRGHAIHRRASCIAPRRAHTPATAIIPVATTAMVNGEKN